MLLCCTPIGQTMFSPAVASFVEMWIAALLMQTSWLNVNSRLDLWSTRTSSLKRDSRGGSATGSKFRHARNRPIWTGRTSRKFSESLPKMCGSFRPRLVEGLDRNSISQCSRSWRWRRGD